MTHQSGYSVSLIRLVASSAELIKIGNGVQEAENFIRAQYRHSFRDREKHFRLAKKHAGIAKDSDVTFPTIEESETFSRSPGRNILIDKYMYRLF